LSLSLLPTVPDILAARDRIAGRVRRTPLVRAGALSDFLDGDVWLKLECEQETGSFKLRGATNVLASLDVAARARGVVASSAGNHGLGIAAAAAALEVRVTVFVPRTAPAVKRERIAALGATIDASAPHYDAAEALAREHARRTGALFVSPCTGMTLLAGQGTIALEVLEELPTVRTIITNVGGGGLAGGIGGYLLGAAPHVTHIGAQSERTSAMARALASGRPADDDHRPTLCDGLAGLVDEEMLAQGRAALDKIVVVPESAVADSIAYLWIEEGRKVEGAGAAGVAALLTGRAEPYEFPVVVIVSGGNIDDSVHKAVLSDNYNSEPTVSN
jgi:threonine dehydratase